MFIFLISHCWCLQVRTSKAIVVSKRHDTVLPRNNRGNFPPCLRVSTRTKNFEIKKIQWLYCKFQSLKTVYVWNSARAVPLGHEFWRVKAHVQGYHRDGHGHGHGVFILATSSKGKWTTNPTLSDSLGYGLTTHKTHRLWLRTPAVPSERAPDSHGNGNGHGHWVTVTVTVYLFVTVTGYHGIYFSNVFQRKMTNQSGPHHCGK